MSIIFECSRPIQWKLGHYESPLMRRIYWLYFAVAILKVPFRDFCEMGQTWENR